MSNMTKAKFRDIIETMIEYKMLDPVRALMDKDYLSERFWMYVESANIASEIMHMEPIL